MSIHWDGKPIRNIKTYRDGLVVGCRLAPDHMPEHIRIAFESEQRRLDALDAKEAWVEQTLAEIAALPEATVLDWPTEPGEYLQ